MRLKLLQCRKQHKMTTPPVDDSAKNAALEEVRKAKAALEEAKKAQSRIETKVTYWNQSANDIKNAKAANHFVDLIKDAILPRGPQRTQGSS